MTARKEVLKAELIDQVCALATDRLSGAKGQSAKTFVKRFYEDIAPRDILGTDPDILFLSALSMWKFASKRSPGQTKLRVFNPELEEHGWSCEHTVIELVHDDMPFLVDSLAAALARQDLTVHLLIHPVMRVNRTGDGKLIEVAVHSDDAPDAKKDVAAESVQHYQVTTQTGSAQLAEIHDRLMVALADVRAAVADWANMRAHMAETMTELDAECTDQKKPRKRSVGPGAHCADVDEEKAFLKWAHNDHFTFLGYREYQFDGPERKGRAVPNSGLGVLRDPDFTIFKELRRLEEQPTEVREFVHNPDRLMVTKSSKRSTVHRDVYMDVIGVKIFNGKGQVTGLRLFAGLFTSVAYSLRPVDIPLLRAKVARVMERTGLRSGSHDGKALTHILETFPRDELFQISDEKLLQISTGIMHLQERQRVALFLRQDKFERFFSCLVYIPRDRYTTEQRIKVQAVLEKNLGGHTADYYTQVGDSPLARLHIIIGTEPGNVPDYDHDIIEDELIEVTRSWSDMLIEALTLTAGEERGQALYRRYQKALPTAYTERFSARTAVFDLERVEEALETGHLCMNLYRPIDADDNQLRFKIYHREHPVPLSEALPMLENMGLKVIDEIPYDVRPANSAIGLVMIQDFGLITGDRRDVDLGAIRKKFQKTFERVWCGEVENDGFNRLVMGAGMTSREVVLLRGFARYLRQAAFTFSQSYMAQTLLRNPAISRALVDLFRLRFDPERGGTDKAYTRQRAGLSELLEAVESADDDRILRRFANILDCTLRTNYFANKPYVSFKLDSSKITDLPLPRPAVEIFVYSPRVEGVHLRGGKVARGGLRWSDRPEDFRTEVLGLMKAQMVKNAVIVPVGSKGGFVVKKPPAQGGREAFLNEGIACYKTFIRGLLDLTDNLDQSGAVVPPDGVTRMDGDDPYLVVAADKGTATFSDIANGISEEYGFWLGDAFASGGSQGYDHKRMGITARGAWESVKRHFREMGTDIQTQDFTAIGVGDMAGDVFGNGMLLSKHTKLVAAFNHMHIFIDPDPDPETSWAERKRLFDTPRTTWADYDPSELSKGGGIHARSAKRIELNAQTRKRFGIGVKTVTPNELIQHLLVAPVDLMWFGGIGTYVKAQTENNADVGDKANDSLRVDAAELRCKVIGEGANLGMTQLGRIEFGRFGADGNGGFANADFIDNSAGVDCSDHEVNIKILLDAIVANGDLTTKQRNLLLARMTDEVSELVLRDNYGQTQAISLVAAQGVGILDHQVRLIRQLERDGRLDRAVEFLPTEEELDERAQQRAGLSRSEISVLIAYGKIWLYDALIASDLPDDELLMEDLVRYFPTPLRKKYRAQIGQHRLRREIIATHITNSIINRVGGFFVAQLAEETGLPADDIARAYTITRDVFGVREIWHGVEGLDNRVPANLQIDMLIEINRLIERGTMWFLRDGDHPLDIGGNVAAFADGVRELAAAFDEILGAEAMSGIEARLRGYEEQGVPHDLARRVAGLMTLVSGCDIVRIAKERRLNMVEVAKLYFAIGPRFGLGWLRAASERLSSDNHWQKLAITAVIEELYRHQSMLTVRVLDCTEPGHSSLEALDVWAGANAQLVARTDAVLDELRAADDLDYAMMAVASRQLRTLAETATQCVVTS